MLARRDLPDSESHMVVTGPWGGFAAAEYAQFQFPGEGGAQWWIDPFAFFREALGIADWPRPDTTTQCGRRIFYTHVDGDGLRNRSELRGGASSGQVILDEILSRYRLPTSVSVVVAEVEPTLLGTPEFHELARAIYTLPNVEAGSHSYTHPLDWEKRTRSFAPAGVPYSVETETAGAIRYMEERLLPPGKRVRLFQWSGSTRVTEEAIAILDRLGVPNINGGDTMRDREWPSYTRVAPLMRQVGRHWQTYTSASNENLYTHLWTGPFYGFRHVIETYENTERPRRVAPVNVYYHYYSGERVASLAALHHVHEWVLRQPLARIFTSEYLAIVAGFRTARIARVPEGWRISGHGALSTVRFDDTRAHLDLDRSSGVLGYLHHQGALYVHLAGPGPALIALRDRPPATAYLVQASHRVTAWKRDAGRVALTLSGLGEKVVELAGIRGGSRGRGGDPRAGRDRGGCACAAGRTGTSRCARARRTTWRCGSGEHRALEARARGARHPRTPRAVGAVGRGPRAGPTWPTGSTRWPSGCSPGRSTATGGTRTSGSVWPRPTRRSAIRTDRSRPWRRRRGRCPDAGMSACSWPTSTGTTRTRPPRRASWRSSPPSRIRTTARSSTACSPATSGWATTSGSSACCASSSRSSPPISRS